MSGLHNAMIPANAARVQDLVDQGHDVNAETPSGMTVIHIAAIKYAIEITIAGVFGLDAQKKRRRWKQTIDPLVTRGLQYAEISLSDPYDEVPIRDILVDNMLHELGYISSDLAERRGYKKYL